MARNKQYFICVKATVCGCRQVFLYAIAEKVSARPVRTHQHRGRRGEESTVYYTSSAAENCQLPEKGKRDMGNTDQRMLK